MANKLKKFFRKTVEAYRKEGGKGVTENIHEHLVKEGVPEHIGKKVHAIVHEPTGKVEGEVGAALKEALEKKRAGKITRDGLTKIVEEAVLEKEKGVPKEELHNIVKEVLKSELRKGEFLAAYEAEQNAKEGKVAPLKGRDIRIALPSTESAAAKKRAEAPVSDVNLSNINITYPLIYKDGKVHVYANIRYDPGTGGLLYKIIEPKLTKEETSDLKKIGDTLIEELEVDFSTLKKQNAENYLHQKVTEVMDYYEMKVSPRTRSLIDYYIDRDFVGLGKVEPMFVDPNLEDISCDGVNIPIYVYHRAPRLGSLRSNTVFNSEDALNSFVMRLAQKCGRSISVADPLLDGALPDGSRVQATYGTGVSTKGSNFTLRKFTRDPLTFVDLVNYGTLNAEILAYLWIAIEHGKSVLIAGPTACGKTTMLNALSTFIRPELKIITIEDTPELRLPHENWIAQVARSGFGPEMGGGKKLGEISLFDLLKASLRQRPDEIIVGEVRGKEAYVLFQQIATGHPGLSTIHADSMEGVITRLRTPPIELPPSLVQHLDILLVMARQRIKGKYIRRTKEIVEVVGYDADKDKPVLNTAYDWDPVKDTYKYLGKSAILKDATEMMGVSAEGISREVQNRMKVINWMATSGLRDYKNVGRVVREYYQNPSKLLKRIS